MDPWRDAPCGLLSFNDAGVVQHANEPLLALLEIEPGGLVGQPIETVLTPGARVFYSTHFFPMLRLYSRAEEIYMSFLARSGAEIPFLITATRSVRDGEGINHCALLTMRSRRELETALIDARHAAESATHAKNEFLAIVSHELRTPLSAILSWVRLARTAKHDAALLARALDTIERNASAQSRLIEDLLDVSRIISGKLRIAAQAMNLCDVIEPAVDSARPAAEAKGIALHFALDRDAGRAHADPARVQQIVWNLVSNAVKFTPPGGRVDLRLHRIGAVVQLQVADTGMGIPSAELPFVFDRFWQASATRSREESGLGLGLAITRRLVELHGGSIRVESRGPGQGSVFSVDLPVDAVPGVKPAPQ